MIWLILITPTLSWIDPLLSSRYEPAQPRTAAAVEVEVEVEVEVIPADNLSTDGLQLLRTSAAAGSSIRTYVHTYTHIHSLEGY